MPGVYLANAAGKHDGLQVAPPLTVGQPHVKRPGKTQDQGLPELVAVIRSAV